MMRRSSFEMPEKVMREFIAERCIDSSSKGGRGGFEEGGVKERWMSLSEAKEKRGRFLWKRRGLGRPVKVVFDSRRRKRWIRGRRER